MDSEAIKRTGTVQWSGVLVYGFPFCCCGTQENTATIDANANMFSTETKDSLLCLKESDGMYVPASNIVLATSANREFEDCWGCGCVSKTSNMVISVVTQDGDRSTQSQIVAGQHPDAARVIGRRVLAAQGRVPLSTDSGVVGSWNKVPGSCALSGLGHTSFTLYSDGHLEIVESSTSSGCVRLLQCKDPRDTERKLSVLWADLMAAESVGMRAAGQARALCLKKPNSLSLEFAEGSQTVVWKGPPSQVFAMHHAITRAWASAKDNDGKVVMDPSQADSVVVEVGTGPTTPGAMPGENTIQYTDGRLQFGPRLLSVVRDGGKGVTAPNNLGLWGKLSITTYPTDNVSYYTTRHVTCSSAVGLAVGQTMAEASYYLFANPLLRLGLVAVAVVALEGDVDGFLGEVGDTAEEDGLGAFLESIALGILHIMLLMFTVAVLLPWRVIQAILFPSTWLRIGGLDGTKEFRLPHAMDPADAVKQLHAIFGSPKAQPAFPLAKQAPAEAFYPAPGPPAGYPVPMPMAVPYPPVQPGLAGPGPLPPAPYNDGVVNPINRAHNMALAMGAPKSFE